MAFHKNDTGKLALAASVAVSILYSLCSILVIVQPNLALKLAAATHHLTTLEQIAPNVKVTIVGFITGLVSVFVFTYVLVSLTGHIYHGLHKNHQGH